MKTPNPPPSPSSYVHQEIYSLNMLVITTVMDIILSMHMTCNHTNLEVRQIQHYLFNTLKRIKFGKYDTLQTQNIPPPPKATSFNFMININWFMWAYKICMSTCTCMWMMGASTRSFCSAKRCVLCKSYPLLLLNISCVHFYM